MRTTFVSVSRGLLFVCLGVIFFLINFGVLSWSFWISVVDLWPLILILLGIGLLFNKRLPFSTILLVFLIALAGYSMIFGDRFVPFRSMNYFYSHNSGMNNFKNSMATDVSLSPDIRKAQIKMNLGGAQVNLGSLGPADNQSQLAKGSYTWENMFGTNGPEFGTQQEGDTMNINLSSNKHGGMKDSLRMDLSNKVKYSLDINAGAINGDFDFSQLEVEKLSLKTGASKFDLRFGDNGLTTEGKIDSGASKLTLVIPENVGLHVHFNGVASETDFMGSGFLLDNKEWSSPGYDQAKTKVNLDISCAAGSIHLIRGQKSEVGGQIIYHS
ncbi:MAG: LiaI-LiaF-like domain-containing protein [Desulfitobacteriaceae bacterium]